MSKPTVVRGVLRCYSLAWTLALAVFAFFFSLVFSAFFATPVFVCGGATAAFWST
jgi:hypothetical protein